jgi:hypothetical protein
LPLRTTKAVIRVRDTLDICASALSGQMIFDNASHLEETMMRLIPRSAVLLALLLPSATAYAQALQRVYVHPQTVRVMPVGATVVRGECADKGVTGAPASTDKIGVFSNPEAILICKFRGGEQIATQRWSDVVAGKEEPWVEFWGASDTSSGVNLQVKMKKLEPGVYYEVRFQEAMVAARPREGLTPELSDKRFTPDLLGRMERFRRPLSQVDNLRTELSVFEADSPIRRLTDAYAQQVVWKISGEVGPEQIEGRTRKYLDDLLTLVRDESPLYRRLAATFLGGRIRAGSPAERFFRARGIDLDDAPLPRELERTVLNLRESLALNLYGADRGYRYGDDVTLPASARRTLSDALRLLARWHEAGIPVGDGRHILASLEMLRGLRFGSEVGENGAVLTAEGSRLKVRDLQSAINECSRLLRSAETLEALKAELSRAAKELIRPGVDERAGLEAVLYLARSHEALGDVLDRVKDGAGVFDVEARQARDRLAFDLFRTAQAVRATKLDLPAKLGEIDKQFGPDAREWGGRLGNNRLVTINGGLSEAQVQSFARELAELEVSTGLTFTLAFSKSPELRAAALPNGGKIALAVDNSLERTDVPGESGPLFKYLSALAEQLRAEDGDIHILVAHTEGDDSFTRWQGMAERGELAGKHWIFGPCPPRLIAQQHKLVRTALDPNIGRVVSVVMSNREVDTISFTMAVQSIVKMRPAERQGVEPIALVRLGLSRSWQRLESCLRAKTEAERDAALQAEFGEELGPVIIRELKRYGVSTFERTLRDQALYYNGVVLRYSSRCSELAC